MTTDNLGAPIAVFDCRDPAWPPPNLEETLAWARSEGIDPADTIRVEVHLIDTLLARVTERQRNEDGRLFCAHAHDHSASAGDCEAAHRTRDVLISSKPPS